MAAKKKKTGAKRKPAHGRSANSNTPRVILARALRGVVDMAVVAIVSATVLGGLLAVKHFGV